ncbi:glycosyltransferase [Patescibacteria group bacterium]|nr:glycosyltransferase [Patescibacteria group bacterium]
MKLLIITQKVDLKDDVLGFFHRWLEEFAKHCEEIIVICLQKGEYQLPRNIKILSLGKETGASRLKYLFNFYRYIWNERHNYEAVFIHMNPEYMILGGVLWRLWRKKLVLWYTHRQVNPKLWIAERFSHHIVTAARESFRLKSSKIRIIGHGIDIEQFKNPDRIRRAFHKPLRIISVGRITPIKNQDILVEAASLIKSRNIDFIMNIVGAPSSEDDLRYFEKLKRLVVQKSIKEQVKFIGVIPNKDMHTFYWENDLSVNLTPTGGIDKVVLESMAAGVPTLVSNKGFADYFGVYAHDLIFKERNSEDLAEKIEKIIIRPDLDELKKFLVSQAVSRGGVERIVKRLIKELQ